MGWEQRGTHQYYYRKQRDGMRVRSIYVGRGELAHLISEFQASSTVLERLTNANKSLESKKEENLFNLTVELIQLFTQAALLTAGFHTHKRQWRRKRSAGY